MANDIRNLSDLKGAPYNPRTISESAAAGLGVSLSEFGDISGITYNKRTGNLVCGHQRVNELRKAYGDLKVRKGVIETPDGNRFAVRVVDWPAERERAANVAANNPHVAGAFTDDVAELLAEIQADDSELFERLGLDKLADDFPWDNPSDGLTDPDDVPEVPVEPVSRTGDLWLLGEHRALCGDSTSADDVARLMDGAKADMVFTDPPYNVQIDYGEHDDNLVKSEYLEFSKKWFSIAKSYTETLLFTPGTGRGLKHPNLLLWQEIENPDRILIWVKKNSVGHSSLGGFNAWEPIYFYGKTVKKIGQDIYDIPITVQKDVADSEGNKLHPTPKQVRLWETVIDDFSNKSATIYEPFLGSGTTLIAAEKLGRKCYGCEIAPQYVDVIVNRWQQFTGNAATLEGDGRTFDEIEQERSAASAGGEK